MKDIRPALRSFLLADPTVNALVGGFRIHHGRLPQGQVDPSVVFNRVSETADYVMGGDSALGQTRMQLDAWALSSDDSTNLANAVYDRLTGQRGDWPGNNETITVKGAFLFNGREDYDDIAKMFRMSRDYMIWYVVA